MKVLISAAETSSDIHGAQLLRALRSESKDPIEAFGVGGPALVAEGLETIIPAHQLLAMGFSEVIGKIPHILRALKKLSLVAAERKPDIIIVIDYPDFHFRLSKRLKRLGIPLIYYIPPKVWAWRRGRLNILRSRFEKVLCILPFEEAFYRKNSVSAKYVGNPLLEELPLNLTRAEARTQLGLSARAQVVTLMPGSRPAEIKRHFEIMLRSAAIAAESVGKLHILLPLPNMMKDATLGRPLEALVKKAARNDLLNITLSYGNSHECLIASDAAIIKSGTSTLEAGLLRCPHAIIYKPSELSAWIFKNVVRYKGPVGLVNIVGGWSRSDPKFFHEILMSEVTAGHLSHEMIDLLKNTHRREALLKASDEVRSIMRVDENLKPSIRAAREVLRVFSARRPQ